MPALRRDGLRCGNANSFLCLLQQPPAVQPRQSSIRYLEQKFPTRHPQKVNRLRCRVPNPPARDTPNPKRLCYRVLSSQVPHTPNPNWRGVLKASAGHLQETKHFPSVTLKSLVLRSQKSSTACHPTPSICQKSAREKGLSRRRKRSCPEFSRTTIMCYGVQLMRPFRALPSHFGCSKLRLI